MNACIAKWPIAVPALLAAWSAAAVAEKSAEKNPWLADSTYALPHSNSAQQDATLIAGPLGRTRRLSPQELDYVHLGPAHFGAFISGPYADGRRVIWSNGLNGVYKLDHDSFRVLAHLAPEDVTKSYDEAEADERIAWFDDSNEGLLALVKAARAGSMLRDLSGVYTMLDKDGRFYVGDKARSVRAYGDAMEGKPDSPIVLKGRYDIPAPVTGNLIGINMTYDGWIVVATEHGYLVAISRDLKQSRWVRLPHAEVAEAASGRPGYGWIRNSFAIDRNNAIYVASRDHLHKVVWTGERLSVDERDGAWSEPYPNTRGEGTGSTPVLMGFGEGEDHFVVFTDGNVLMNVTLMWRDAIPPEWKTLPGLPSRRIAASAPATMGKLNLQAIQSEQAVVVAGYGALVVNNQPRNVPWFLPQRAVPLLISFLGSSPRYQPYGAEKFQWNPQTRKLGLAWVAEQISSPSCVPMVSLGSRRLYLIGARENQWTLEALNWDTGAEDFHWIVGGQRYNSLFAGTLLDQAGRILYGTPWGRVRLRPEQP